MPEALSSPASTDVASASFTDFATRPPHSPPAILVLLPFLVIGALSLSVLRAMRERGLDIHVGFYLLRGGGYTPDMAEDFAAEGRLVDLTDAHGDAGCRVLAAIVRDRGISLILQIGSPWAYRQLPYVKEACPGVRVVDTLYNKVGHTLNHFLYENCFDGVIVESLDMQQFVETNTANSRPDVRRVESGIDLDHFTFLERPPHGGKLTISYFGRMSAEKNPLGFVDLADRLHAVIPNLRFTMFGEGDMSAAVKARITSSTSGGFVTFEGFVDNSLDAYRQMDVLVVPSKLDGRPNVIMEASACGIPVIGAPVGGIPELIEAGRNGILSEVTDTETIAVQLRTWLENPPAFRQARIQARQVAERRFDRKWMLDAYEKVFRDFAQPGERRTAEPSIASE